MGIWNTLKGRLFEPSDHPALVSEENFINRTEFLSDLVTGTFMTQSDASKEATVKLAIGAACTYLHENQQRNSDLMGPTMLHLEFGFCTVHISELREDLPSVLSALTYWRTGFHWDRPGVQAFLMDWRFSANVSITFSLNTSWRTGGEVGIVGEYNRTALANDIESILSALGF